MDTQPQQDSLHTSSDTWLMKLKELPTISCALLSFILAKVLAIEPLEILIPETQIDFQGSKRARAPYHELISIFRFPIRQSTLLSRINSVLASADGKQLQF